MKILHTSDWHIGKIIHETNLLPEQKKVLESFVKIVEEEEPDMVIIAGDLYDRGIPSKEAVRLLDEVLYQLIEGLKVKVFAISGNHDSPDRLDFASHILEKNDLYIEGKMSTEVRKVTLEDEYGRLHIYLVPFCFVSEMRDLLQDGNIHSYEEAYLSLMKKISVNFHAHERNILITHGFIVNMGEETEKVDESVRPLSIGNLETVNVESINIFDYVALGHLHKPQKVKYEHIRYSGSLMKYSFSEADHQKGVVMVEIKEKGDVQVWNRSLEGNRGMRCLEGKFLELMQSIPTEEEKEAFTMITLTDEAPIYEAIAQLRTVFPRILRLEYKAPAGIQSTSFKKDKIEQRSELELFSEFYEDLTGKEIGERQVEIAKEIFTEILLERRDEE